MQAGSIALRGAVARVHHTPSSARPMAQQSSKKVTLINTGAGRLHSHAQGIAHSGTSPAPLPALARSCDEASTPCKVRRTRGNLPRSGKQTLLRDQVEGALAAIGK